MRMRVIARRLEIVAEVEVVERGLCLGKLFRIILCAGFFTLAPVTKPYLK